MIRHILTLAGPDRPGIVHTISEIVREAGGNWKASKLARLGGQFAGVVEFDAPASATTPLRSALADALGAAFALALHAEGAPPADTGSSWSIDLQANDRPGIVRDVTRAVASVGANIEDWESRVSSAPMSGSPLFELTGHVRLPAGQGPDALRAALESLSPDLAIHLRLAGPDDPVH